MPSTDKPKKPKKKKQERRARGEGAVFFSESKKCWVWKAIVGQKPTGGVQYKQGRAKTQAAALLRKQNAERGQNQPHELKLTVGAHLDHWLNDIAKPNTRNNTWVRYEQCVRLHLKPRIGGMPLKKLTVASVTTLWADLGRDGVGAGTVKKCSEVLATALAVAVSEERIAVAPTANASKPKVMSEAIDVFSDDEVKLILKAAASHRLHALWALALGTGARQGELLALTVADFDLAAGTVRIERMVDQRKGGFTVQAPKSKAGTRTVTLPRYALEPVKAHLKDRGPGPVFTTASGKYIARNNLVNQDWNPLLAAAKVPYRKFHTTRHTHASRLLAAGVDPAEVAKRLGDRIETLLKVYSHFMPDTRRDTAAKLDAIYGETLEPTRDL